MLEIRNLDVHYRGIQALRGVNLHVKQGEIFALIGPNGAGKSSLVNALSGLVPAGGEIRFEGQPLGRMPAHLRSRAGIIQVPEGRRVIAPLSVAENLELGRQAELHSCDDCDSCGNQTVLQAALQPGHHWLLVEGYSTSAGRYKAAAWFVPGPLLDRDRDRDGPDVDDWVQQ